VATLLGSVAVVSLGALVTIAYLPTGGVYTLFRVVIFGAAAALIVYAAAPFGRKAAPAVLVAVAVGAFSLFSLKTMIDVSYERGDVPKDMLIYTQSSPEIAQIATEINQLAAATGKGYNMPIAVDSTDSFAWPWAWYLRDYKQVSYVDFTNGAPSGQFDVMLVNSSNLAKVNDQLLQSGSTQYQSPIKYPHRWWFDENYKLAMSTTTDSNGVPQSCLTKSGDCGPYNVDTWKTIASGIFDKNWLSTWFYYWRDKNPDEITGAQGDLACNSCGSVDAYAFFPANYDIAKGAISAKPVEAPKPTTDSSGRPQFGGIGTQPGQFFSPVDAESDAAGNLYVIDSSSKRLQKFDANGNYLASFGDQDGPGRLERPAGVGVDSVGNVYVSDYAKHLVQVYKTDGSLLQTLTGDATVSKWGATYIAADPEMTALRTANAEAVKAWESPFASPMGVAVDAEDRIIICDSARNRVQIYQRR